MGRFRATHSKPSWPALNGSAGVWTASDRDEFLVNLQKAILAVKNGVAPEEAIRRLQSWYPRLGANVVPADVLEFNPPPFDLLTYSTWEFAHADCGLDSRFTPYGDCCNPVRHFAEKLLRESCLRGQRYTQPSCLVGAEAICRGVPWPSNLVPEW